MQYSCTKLAKIFIVLQGNVQQNYCSCTVYHACVTILKYAPNAIILYYIIIDTYYF